MKTPYTIPGFHYLLFIIISSNVHAQKIITSHKVSDSIKAYEWSEKSWFFRDRIPDSSYYYAKKAYELAAEYDLRRIMAYSLADIGMYQVNHAHFDEGLNTLYESLRLRKAYRNFQDVISAYNNLGILYNRNQLFDSATSVFEKGIILSERSNDSKTLGALLNGLATTKSNIANYQDAEKLIRRSLEIAIQDKDSIAMASRYQTLGILYQKVNRPSLALENFNQAENIYQAQSITKGLIDITINKSAILLKLKKYPQVLEILRGSLKKSIELGYLDNLIIIHNNLGLAYQALGKVDSAIAQFERGILIAQDQTKTRDFVELTLNFSQLKNGLGDYKQVLGFLSGIEKEFNAPKVKLYLPEFYMIRSQAYAGLGNFKKAFEDRVLFNAIHENREQKIDDTQNQLAAMEISLRDKEILEKENDLQKSKIRQQSIENRNQQLISSIIILGLLSTIFILYYRWRTKNKALEEKKKSDEKLLEVLRHVDIQLLEAQIEANNATSFKIGQDLHDNLGSKLAVVQTSIEGIRKKVASSDPNIAERFDKVEQWLEQSCDDLRNIAHDLQDRDLKQRGLENEIELYARLINEANGMRVLFIPEKLPGKLQEDDQKEIAAIARLLIENVLRHAEAEEVTIRLQSDNDHVTLLVEDNGRGFDAENEVNLKGRGLANAKLRAEKLGGKFILLSKPGLGTKAQLEIPLNKL